ncbi:MAG: cytochrome c [Lysinibacillus sp.]
MKNNPIVPYILILAFGIGLIFFMSVLGAEDKKEIADAGKEGTEQSGGGATTEGGDDAALVQSCISCHGGDLTGGGVGPDLTGLDAERITDVLVNGIEGTMMTKGMKTEDEAKAIAEYISTLK